MISESGGCSYGHRDTVTATALSHSHVYDLSLRLADSFRCCDDDAARSAGFLCFSNTGKLRENPVSEDFILFYFFCPEVNE